MAITGIAWGLYFIPHLRACALLLDPGALLGFSLFYRNGGLTISNPAFITFETVFNIAIYTATVWLIIFLLSKRTPHADSP